MKRKIVALFVVIGVIFASVFSAMSASVVVSKHNLAGPYDPSEQVCVYCHTPHFANSGNLSGVPLWNRSSGNTSFTMYSSATIDAAIANAPSPNSLACLGCHDGVNANNNKHDLLNGPGSGSIPDTTSWPNCRRCHPQMYGSPAVNWIGTDLKKSHPVSIVYPTAAQDPGFHIPPDLQKGWTASPSVPLYRGKVECPSCHNVHDPEKVPFLRMANSGSDLCFKCHNK